MFTAACPNCQRPIPPPHPVKFCGSCGTQLDPAIFDKASAGQVKPELLVMNNPNMPVNTQGMMMNNPNMPVNMMQGMMMNNPNIPVSTQMPPSFAPPPSYGSSNNDQAFSLPPQPVRILTQNDNNTYGFTYFCCKFMWQADRVLGFLAITISIIVMLLAMEMDQLAFTFFIVMESIPFLLLALFNYAYKMKVLGLTMNDCLWPGLHILAYQVVFHTCLFHILYLCPPSQNESDNDDWYDAYYHIAEPIKPLIPGLNFTSPNPTPYHCYRDDMGGGYYMLILAGLGYLFVCCKHHDIRGAFSNPRVGFAKAGDDIYEACQSHPSVWIKGEAYHYETRTRTVSDGNGGSKTETYQEKVVTSTDCDPFTYEDVRVVGPTFNVANFKNDSSWNTWISVFSGRFFTEIGDDETKKAIEQHMAHMRARMSGRDQHCGAWKEIQGSEFVEMIVFPLRKNAETEAQQKQAAAATSSRLKRLGIFMMMTGCAFWYLCYLGFIAHNPVLRYVKEISVRKFEGKQIVVINQAGGNFSERGAQGVEMSVLDAAKEDDAKTAKKVLELNKGGGKRKKAVWIISLILIAIILIAISGAFEDSDDDYESCIEEQDACNESDGCAGCTVDGDGNALEDPSTLCTWIEHEDFDTCQLTDRSGHCEAAQHEGCWR